MNRGMKKQETIQFPLATAPEPTAEQLANPLGEIEEVTHNPAPFPNCDVICLEHDGDHVLEEKPAGRFGKRQSRSRLKPISQFVNLPSIKAPKSKLSAEPKSSPVRSCACGIRC